MPFQPGLLGKSGDHILLWSTFSGTSTNITDNEWVLLTNASDTPTIPMDELAKISGVESYHFQFTADFGNDTPGETVHLRPRAFPELEVTYDGSGSNYSDISPKAEFNPDDFSSTPRWYFEGRTSGTNQLSFDCPTWMIWAELE